MPSRFWAASGDALLPGKSFLAPSGGTATTWGTQADWDIVGLQATRNRTGTFWGLLHASAAKANGTYIATINVIGSATTDYVGLDDGTEANNLGSDGSGASFGWTQAGQFIYGGAVQGSVTLPTYTAADVLKMVKAANNVSFYKNGTFITTVDLASAGFGSFTRLTGAAYPSVCSLHATGMQLTADFTGW